MTAQALRSRRLLQVHGSSRLCQLITPLHSLRTSETPLLAVFYDTLAAKEAGSAAEAAMLAAKMPALQEAAAALTVPNAFGALLQRQGAVGLNAATSHVRPAICPAP